ncbi:hypothetical protein CES85_3681 (plasmid) [Ochrobactrum quorumnocens]|uniref:Uncharacterized protein n=1 Tax=Ochrobactrum quorumnocens TaxID=271865 RepID=A0A248UMM2_9HYPH|nr:hypothetical protein CES85_3681 [[Ochrobactrum] quorumnocens]
MAAAVSISACLADTFSAAQSHRFTKEGTSANRKIPKKRRHPPTSWVERGHYMLDFGHWRFIVYFSNLSFRLQQ